jgi:hypothetical protein
MDRKARQRILRSFLASLIQSELSVDDLRALAIELDTGSLGQELSQIILDTIRGIAKFDDNSANADFPADDPLDEALNAIQTRKMPKKMVMELMKIASPSLREPTIAPSMQKSLSQGLRRFFESATENERQVFLEILSGKSADAYLKGITSR